MALIWADEGAGAAGEIAGFLGDKCWIGKPLVEMDTVGATCMAEPRDTLEDVHEPFLLREGLLARTPRGRVALDVDGLANACAVPATSVSPWSLARRHPDQDP